MSTASAANIDSVISGRPIPPNLRPEHRSASAGERTPTWNRESRVLPPLPGTSTPTAKMSVDDTVAATDLQNPADALEFLANVAERDSGSNMLPPIQGYGRSQRGLSMTTSILNEKARGSEHHPTADGLSYPPLARGQVTFDMIQTLLYR